MNPKRRAQRAKRKRTQLQRERDHRAQHHKEPMWKNGILGERIPLTRRARIIQQKCEHEPGILQRDQGDNAWRLCEKCGAVVSFESGGEHVVSASD